MAIAAARWSANGNENCIGGWNMLGRLRRESESLCCDVPRDKFVQAGLVDWHAPGLQSLDFSDVLVNADHIMAKISKTCTGY